MHENFDPKPLENPERYELLSELGRFKLTLEAFEERMRRSKTILEAARDLPLDAQGRDEVISRLLAEMDAWQDSIRVVLDDHIAPLVKKLAP